MGHKKIAVIGAGISGMGAAHMLQGQHAVTLFEAEPRLGGHARTRMAGRNADTPVDTGFIVFNYANYPHLAKLFAELEVPVVPSNMSFGASIGGGRLEYGLASLGALFAQRRNAVDPRFLGMVRDVLRFNKRALRLAQADQDMTVGGFLDLLGTGKWFRDYYLLPLSGAIWSTPTEKIMDFPAHAMIQFFENHALLNYSGQHQWYTVEGGSRQYVSRLEAALTRNGVDIRLNAPVQSVRRTGFGAEVKARGGAWEAFDEVVFATHSDDTLWMLADPSAQEQSVLGAIKYQPNDIVLHSDESVMPRRRQTWSSWVYTEAADASSERIDLTYWMNSLQPWLKNEQFFVTLNTRRDIRPDLIWDQATLRHPVYDLAALAAQKQAAQMNGTNHTWLCGAWMKNGFHEDGLSSAFDVAQDLLTPQGMLAAE
ncbi:FAD-dependent oxidoreductase [Photobacterium sp. TY 1-4]|uniref:FAD-dependent oxidoreductase n=2 Tax=Pseudosulfitobacter koreensis TaxID=2968472 RepID=A0ABT1Z1A5_9RHOB|nr:FAD-dependent oxidoreductase [Pseudosulfitobacter koreense]MCR8826917.1 FAD-dependent oxidoreductase [Pseudosulfitobacter koreense]